LDTDVRANAREVVELLGIDLGKLLGIPAADQELHPGGRHFGRIVPPGARKNQAGSAQVWLFAVRDVGHGVIVLLTVLRAQWLASPIIPTPPPGAALRTGRWEGLTPMLIRAQSP